MGQRAFFSTVGEFLSLRQAFPVWLPEFSGKPAGTQQRRKLQEGNIMLGTILLVVLILMLIGAIPRWPYSREWGYYPSSGVGLVLLILLILLLTGHL
jgi:hypothetical protein